MPSQAFFGDPFFPASGAAADSSKYTGMPYSSPFATQGRLWTPMEIQFLFRACRFYYLMNPLINSVTTKMAMYPITEVLIKDKDRSVREFYEDYYQKDIDLHTHLIEMGLDYNVYGNALSSVYFPFKKYLVCGHCKKRTLADQASFEFAGGDFSLSCRHCGNSGTARAEDDYIKNPNGIRIIRWNPEDFHIHYSELTGERLYQWIMPHQLRYDIMMGKKHVVTRVPQEFLWAVRENKPLTFNEDKLFHMRRPSISSRSLGRAWGVPMVLPVLEDVFYLQVLRKAQEQVATEHLVPLRILFPQGTNPGDQPYNFMNLSEWQDQVQEEILKWRRDRNYVPVLPVPVGNQTISGDGRALLLHQEIRVISEHIVSGMGTPVEFAFGGLSYSGSSLSMRMLENVMLNYRQSFLRYLRWVSHQIAGYMGWPSVELGLKDFRMADDLNRRQYLFNLWQAKLICDQDLLEESGHDAAEQREKRRAEEKARFEEQEREMLAQTEAQIKAQRKQMKAQQEMQEEMMAAQGGMPQEGMPPEEAGMEGEMMEGEGAEMAPDQSAMLPMIAQQIAQQIVSLPAEQRSAEIARIRRESPEIADMVMQMIGGASAQAQPVESLPEQLPPRRGAESALV